MEVIIDKQSRIIARVEFLQMQDAGTWLDAYTWAPLLTPATHEIAEMNSLPQFYVDGCYKLTKAGEPEIIPEMFEQVKQHVMAKEMWSINDTVSTTILNGFNYEVGIGRSEKQMFHFSYDAHDQRNFTNTAVAAMLQKSNSVARADSKFYFRGRNEQSGEQMFSFSPDLFLDLYYNGALAHQSRCLETGWEAKQALEAAQTLEDISNALTTFNNAIAKIVEEQVIPGASEEPVPGEPEEPEEPTPTPEEVQ